MSQHQVLEDISASKVKQSLTCLLYCENVNYCMLIMGHCDSGEQQEWVAKPCAFVRIPVGYQCRWTEIRDSLIGLCIVRTFISKKTAKER